MAFVSPLSVSAFAPACAQPAASAFVPACAPPRWRGAPPSARAPPFSMVSANPSPVTSSTPAQATQSAAPPAEPLFGRVVTAMVTPFKRGNSEVNYSAAEKLAAHLVAHGSDALVVAGTTGESPTLSWTEQYELFTVVRNAVGHRVKLIAGAGSNSTAEAVDATRRAEKLGFDATLQVVPYYNKPPQEGMYRHFKAIADACPDLPVILYNIPGRTGVNMAPDTVARLADVPNIVGLKQSSNNLDHFVAIRKSTPSSFALYSGDDGLTLPFLALGGAGVVSVASHFIGPQMQQLVSHYLSGNVDAANAIHMRYTPLFDSLFCMTNPVPTKTALRLQGWPVGGCRLPLIDAPPDVEAELGRVFADLDLL